MKKMLANDDGGTIAVSVEDVTPLAATPLATILVAVNVVAGDDIELVICSSIFAGPVAPSCQ
jgi:hypothetical protein